MDRDLQPILKWVGGKRKLMPSIKPVIEEAGDFNKYIEPFLGGGAALFSLKPQLAIVNDLNSDLINLYRVILEHPNELIEKLGEFKNLHNVDFYSNIRGLDRGVDFLESCPILRAARLVYLNKTCFNGLYRVNSKGYFNTPIGSYKTPKILDAEMILGVSQYFNENDICMLCGHYGVALDLAESGDFVYLDPPYVPISTTANFTSYTAEKFNMDNQIELRDRCLELSNRGVKFLQSNSDCELVSDLYAEFNIRHINVTRTVNATVGKSKFIKEVLITNY